jgi:hypothetical protein
MTPTEAYPRAFFNFQNGIYGMDEIEFTGGVSRVQFPIAAERSGAIGAGLDHGHSIHQPAVALGVSLKRLDDEPLIGVASPDFFPAHTGSKLPPGQRPSNFSTSSNAVDEKSMNRLSNGRITSSFRPRPTCLISLTLSQEVRLAKAVGNRSTPPPTRASAQSPALLAVARHKGEIVDRIRCAI